MKKKGFTLIELLAVIVILGVIMIIAIPSVTSYITNSRKDSYIADAKMFVNAAKTKLTADATLPQDAGAKVKVPIADIELDKGGEKSPYGNDWNYDYSFIEVVNVGTSSDPEYVWKVMLEDTKGNCIPLTDMNALRREDVGTGCSKTMVALNPKGIIPEGGVYYSGITYFNYDTLEVYADEIYMPGDEFPEVISDGDIYMYGDYAYGYNTLLVELFEPSSLDTGGLLFMSNNYDSNLEIFYEMDGWSVTIFDDTKEKYEDILESINGVPITNLDYTFEACENMVEAPKLPDTVTSMRNTFYYCISLVKPPVLPTALVDMYWTFEYCSSLVEMPIIPPLVEDMNRAFAYCESLKKATNIPSRVNNMGEAFRECTSLVEPPIMEKNTSGDLVMYHSFYGCTSLVKTPVFPKGVTDLSSAFYNCTSLESVSPIPSTVRGMSFAFDGCINLGGEIEFHIVEAETYGLVDIFNETVKPIKIIGTSPDTIKAQIARFSDNVTY